MRHLLVVTIIIYHFSHGVAQIQTPQPPTFNKPQPVIPGGSTGGHTPKPAPPPNKPSTVHYSGGNKTFPNDVRKDVQANNGYSKYTDPAAVAIDPRFEKAFQQLHDMLRKKEWDFKKAVFITENAYDSTLLYGIYQEKINKLTRQSRYLAHLIPGFAKDTFMAYTYGLKSLMVDTLPIQKQGKVYNEVTFTYDFDDVFGKGDIRKMFVSKLLKQGTGNCHSFPYLYKIVAQELGIGDQVHLAYAPNHVFIRMKLDGAWWNLELTSGHFVQDWFMMATGYVHVSGVQGKIYMTPLDEQQSIAACLMDLATYYEDRYGMDNFVLKCAMLALEFYPDCIQALMVQTNYWNIATRYHMKRLGITDVEGARKNPDTAYTLTQMEETMKTMQAKGYVEVPEEVYKQWLEEMQQEKERRAGFK